MAPTKEETEAAEKAALSQGDSSTEVKIDDDAAAAEAAKTNAADQKAADAKAARQAKTDAKAQDQAAQEQADRQADAAAALAQADADVAQAKGAADRAVMEADLTRQKTTATVATRDLGRITANDAGHFTHEIDEPPSK